MLDGIVVRNDPVNWVDPWGLMMYQLRSPFYGPRDKDDPPFIDELPPNPVPYPIPFIKPPIHYVDPDKAWDDKVDQLNSYLGEKWTVSPEIGEMLGDSICVLVCMMKKYPELFLDGTVSSTFVKGLAILAPEAVWPVLLLEFGSDIDTALKVYKAFENCIKEECCEM